jgi:ATP-dependent protease ClpP protease subunit
MFKKPIEDKPKILSKKRIVPITNKITEEYGNQVIKSLVKLITNKQPIFVPIRSTGGDFLTAKKIKQTIENIKDRGIPIIGIAIGEVWSAACFTFESCSRRYIEQDAVLIPRILHALCNYQFELTPYTTLAEVHGPLDELVKMEREKMRIEQRNVFKSYAERVGITLSPIEASRLYLSGKPITAKRSVEVGLADTIIQKFSFDNPTAIL